MGSGSFKRLRFLIDQSWSAREIADNARTFARQRYRGHPEVIEMCEGLMQAASETKLWSLLKPQERSLLSDSPIIVVPTGEFDVWTATAPSGDGYYIVFDLCIILELLEFFASVPNQGYPAWSACVLSGARRKTTGPRMHLAAWVQDPMSKLIEHLARNQLQIPYASSMLFGIPFALSFMIGHEYAHHALKHFADGHIITSTTMDPAKARPRGSNHAMEFAADAWSMYIISRLPALELSSWLLAIEMMFLYMHLVEFFNEACRTIRGLAVPPTAIRRSSRARSGFPGSANAFSCPSSMRPEICLTRCTTIWTAARRYSIR
jgi:hypothetical protein